ncbi:MAG: MMPL family transporter [Gammaproteobacteria bacterium]|nr:MMPL family transporter [Gammaproteobacteria bacterium]
MKIADYAERLFGGLAETLVSYRRLVLLATIALMAAAFWGISKVRVDTSISSIFTPQDPAYLAYTDYLSEFDSDEILYVLYETRQRDGVFDLESMRTVANLTEVLADEVPFVDKVTSLANVEFIQAVGENDIDINDLMIDLPKSQAAMEQLRPKVMAKQNYRNLVLSGDGKYAAIILEMAASRLDPLEDLKFDPQGSTLSSNLYPTVSYAKVKEILERPEYRQLEFYLTGDVSINAERNRMVTYNNAMIVIASLIVVLLLSMIFFNATWVGILGPLFIVIMSILATVGLMGLNGWAIGIFFGMVPTLLCAIGVAQSVHILIDYQRALIETHDRNVAIISAIRKVGGPCLLAASTTALSFLVMLTSQMQSMREMALYASAGVMLAFLFSVCLLAAFMSRSGANHQVKNLYQDFSIHVTVLSVIERVIGHNRKMPGLILAISFAVIIGSILGLAKLQVQVELIEDFKPSVEVRQHTEFVEDKMSGNASLVFLINSGQPDGVKNIEFMLALERLQQYADTLPLVRDSRSLVNIVKEVNQSFNQDQASYFALPAASELLAQYLLVYEFSGGEQLGDFVSLDYSNTVLKLRLAMASSQEISGVVDAMNRYIDENPIADSTVQTTGMGLLWVKIGEYVINTQVASYILVFGMIGILVSVVFGSIKVGAVSMIPNLGPIFVCMGGMGWLGIPLDHYKIMLGAIALGIAVDDTIHLVTRFRSRFLSTGNYDKAMARCLRDVGPALIITTLILVGAFATYMLSEMQTLASFGILLGTSITLALLADLYLMPCLITRLQLFGPEFDVETNDVEHIFDRFDSSRDGRGLVLD